MDAADWPAVGTRLDLGCGVSIVLVEYEGAVVGLEETHLNQEGQPCRGWVALDSAPEQLRAHSCWHVVSKNPLTLTPSIKCRACGNHGFIREGRWVPA
jgi:hypothetical protein